MNLTVQLGERSYPILIGSGLLSARCEPLLALAQGRQVAIVTNDVVAPLYAGPLQQALAQLKGQPVKASKTLALRKEEPKTE